MELSKILGLGVGASTKNAGKSGAGWLGGREITNSHFHTTSANEHRASTCGIAGGSISSSPGPVRASQHHVGSDDTLMRQSTYNGSNITPPHPNEYEVAALMVSLSHFGTPSFQPLAPVQSAGPTDSMMEIEMSNPNVSVSPSQDRINSNPIKNETQTKRIHPLLSTGSSSSILVIKKKADTSRTTRNSPTVSIKSLPRSTGCATSPTTRKLIPSPSGLPCPNCSVETSTLWRTCDVGGTNSHLCNACGLRFKKGKFCPICYKVYYDADTNHKNWNQCQTCYNWTHKECLTTKMDLQDNEGADSTIQKKLDQEPIKKPGYRCVNCAH